MIGWVWLLPSTSKQPPGSGKEKENAWGPTVQTCLYQERQMSFGTQARTQKELKAIWMLTIFPEDAWQPCIHSSLVDVSIKAQDVNLIMLRRGRDMLACYHCNILSLLLGGLECRHHQQAVLRTRPGNREPCL